VYLFENIGAENSDKVIELAIAKAEQYKIKRIIIASGSGKTALKLAEKAAGKEITIVAVTHCTGFLKPDFQELSEENRDKLNSLGVKVVTGTHALGTVGRAVRRKYGTYEIDEIIANSLRIFGQGVKVAVEISMMAADAGAVNSSELAIAIGGSEEGADCAIVLKPDNTHNFFDIKVNEIICKPKLF